MAHERVPGLYEDNATAWDRQRGTDLIEKLWLDRFLNLLPRKPSILDAGCGSGEPIDRYLIERGASVTGVDSSPSLIAICRERFRDQEWIVGDMRSLDLRRRFNGVLAWHSSFHLTPDQQRQLIPRLIAHLMPGGAMMFTSGPKAGESIGEWQGEPLYHASLEPAEYEALLSSNGLRVVEKCLNNPDCGGASIWLAQMIPASGLLGSA